MSEEVLAVYDAAVAGAVCGAESLPVGDTLAGDGVGVSEYYAGNYGGGEASVGYAVAVGTAVADKEVCAG